jgi:hypothetical protein
MRVIYITAVALQFYASILWIFLIFTVYFCGMKRYTESPPCREKRTSGRRNASSALFNHDHIWSFSTNNPKNMGHLNSVHRHPRFTLSLIVLLLLTALLLLAPRPGATSFDTLNESLNHIWRRA